MWKSSVYFSAPPLSASAPRFVCSGNGIARMLLPVVSVFAMFLLQDRVSIAFPVTSFIFVDSV